MNPNDNHVSFSQMVGLATLDVLTELSIDHSATGYEGGFAIGHAVSFSCTSTRPAPSLCAPVTLYPSRCASPPFLVSALATLA